MRAMRRAANRRRRDPAPSRLSYKVHRWMLTPAIRGALRRVLPVALVVVGAAYALGTGDRLAAVEERLRAAWDQIQERPEFMVNLMAVDGASPQVAADIRDALALDLPVSSFDLDLDALRGRVEQLRTVRQAGLRVRSGGILQVDVDERVPVLVWRGAAGLELVDAEGVSVAEIARRAERPDLPLVAGAGARERAGEALRILDAASPVRDRVRGLVRVGERRWDIALDGARIMLPERDPVAAARQAMALRGAHGLLDSGSRLAALDMRIAGRPTLRWREEPAPGGPQVAGPGDGATPPSGSRAAGAAAPRDGAALDGGDRG